MAPVKSSSTEKQLADYDEAERRAIVDIERALASLTLESRKRVLERLSQEHAMGGDGSHPRRSGT